MARSILRVSVVALALCAGIVVPAAQDDSYCKKDCVTNVVAKGAITRNGSRKGFRLATDHGELTWTFRKGGNVATTLNIENFSPDCPGTFVVDGAEQPRCGFTLAWNAGDTSSRVVRLGDHTAGTFHFHVYSRDNGDDHNPNDIDPELEIDRSFAALFSIGQIVTAVAALLALALVFGIGYQRGRAVNRM